MKHLIRGVLAAAALALAVPSLAAFPTREEVSTTPFDSETTAHEITNPTTVNEDDLLLYIVALYDQAADAPTITTPSGLTLLQSDLYEFIDASVENRTAVYYDIADGTEGEDSIDFVTSAGAYMAVTVIRYSNWEGSASGINITTTAATGLSTTPDPPSLTAAGGSGDTAWIAIASGVDDAVTLSSAPSSYTNSDFNIAGTGSNNQNVHISVAFRDNATATENPGTFTWSASDAYIALTIGIEESAAVAPAFSVAPTVSATTATSYTLSYTADSASTFYAVACTPAETAPNAAQIITGDCGSGADAESSVNEAVTGADTTDLTSITFPRHDIYAVLNNANGSGAVTTLADEDRSARSGYEIVILDSVSVTSFLDDDAYFDPDVEDFDILEVETDTVGYSNADGDTDGSTGVITGMADTSGFVVDQEVEVSAGFATTGPFTITAVSTSSITVDTNSNSAQNDVTVTNTYPITWATDGDFTYTDPTGTWQSIDYCVQDDSTVASEFTTPDCWTSGDDTLWINNNAPTENGSFTDPIWFTEDEAITSIDFCAAFDDVDGGDQGTLSVTSGTLNNGLSLGSTGSCMLSGTPDTEAESANAVTLTYTDQAGETATLAQDFYVINTVTLGDIVTGNDRFDAEADMDALRPWLVEDPLLTLSAVCSDEAADTMVSQNPAASTEITGDEAVTGTYSSGVACITGGAGLIKPKGSRLSGVNQGINE